jgi:hypothetical protein
MFKNILFSKIEYSKLINCLGGMCQSCQGIIIYGMFGMKNFENWNLKFVCEMFGIWKFENQNVQIGMCEYLNLKIEIKKWNIYVKPLKFEILKTKMSKFGCNIEIWKLNFENSLWGV